MNIDLTPNSSNQMFTNVSDMVTISNPYFLWRFYNEETKGESLLYITNQTPLNDRYDRFDITLPTDVDLNEGKYRFYVYQNDNNVDVDYDNMTLLREGVLTVVTSFNADTYYEPTGTDKYYEPE